MAKPKATGKPKKKSPTVGSPGHVGKGRGRPRKLRAPNTSRKGNYRCKYTPSMFMAAMKDVQENHMTVRAAAIKHKVPKSTLGDRIKGVHGWQLGRPTELSVREEEIIVERIKILGDWGFPFTKLDLRFYIRRYLNLKGKQSARFEDNMPGKDFADGFVKRHQTLTLRSANLIKRSRAKVSREKIMEFFTNFLPISQGVPAGNIVNYDETNLRDDPGSKKCLFKRGTKYAEQVSDFSKSSVSVMFAGSATGHVFPPYIVYKAENLYESWTSGGPKGARYAVSKSGWFTMKEFNDWFKSIFLPWAVKREGKKILIGDNLSSHIDPEVIHLCAQNDIIFVCFPANSTHLIQPLDVGVFGPMKSAWRNQLRKYKAAYDGINCVQKTFFPKMVKEMMAELHTEQHLPKAFEKCGLSPLNPAKVLDRIPCPESTTDICTNVDNALVDTLQANRFGDKMRIPARGPKIPAGCSWSTDEESEGEGDELEGTAGDSEMEISGTAQDERDETADDSDEDGDSDHAEDEELNVGASPRGDLIGGCGSKYIPGSMVAAIYQGDWYIAEILENQDGVPKGYRRLDYMKKCKGSNTFSGGSKDILLTHLDDIIQEVIPVPVNSRGCFGLEKKELSCVNKFMANSKK